MDFTEEMEAGMVCHNCHKRKENVLASLNISCNESNSMLVFWNKYQIFIHEDCNLEEASRVLVPEFLVSQIITSSNYLLCLDCDGSIHVASLKFKNNDPKRLKSSFQPRAHNILKFIQYSPDTTMSLKKELQTYSFCIHKIDSSFEIKKKTVFNLEPDCPITPSTQENCILISKLVTNSELDSLREVFKTKESWRPDTSIVIVSFDSINVHGCVYSQDMMAEDIKLVKLYTSPTQICDIIIQESKNLHLMIGLKCGTVIRQNLFESNKIQDVVHLNTAINKFIALKGSDILYSDGLSMWKSQNTFTKEIKLQKLIVNQPKDFIQVGDRIICTTYSNITYSFYINNESSYDNNTEVIGEYCPAGKLLKNSECLKEIMAQIEKNNNLIRKVNEENSHITTLSLSKRPDIMNKVINNEIIVYESYEEVIQENKNATLTEKLSEYFEPELFLFLIKITVNMMQHTLSEVLSNLLADIKIHISFSTENNIVKTTSIKLTEPLKCEQFLVPIRSDMLDSTEISTNLRLVLNLPGCMEAKETVWTVLYEKETVLYSEHFIKTSPGLTVNLTEPKENIAELIKKTATHEHGTLFEFSEIPKSNSKEWSLYITLPENYKTILQNEDYYKSKFSQSKASFLHKNLTSQDFLKSKHKLTFEIGTERVKIEIIDDFCSPMMKVSSINMKKAFNLRNFLVNLIYNDFKDCGPEKEFVKSSLYTTIENLQKAVKKSLARGSQSELLSLAEQFQKSVIGAFPI